MRGMEGRTRGADPVPGPELAAFELGQVAHLAGDALSSCPYGHEQQAIRKAWVRGWLDRAATGHDEAAPPSA